MHDDETLSDVLESFSHWLSNPNIVGIHIGKKTVDGKEQEVQALVVDVVKKKRPDELNATDLVIPETVAVDLPAEEGAAKRFRRMDLPTDVVETGQVLDEEEILGTEDDVEEDLNVKRRPCPGGYFVQTSGLNVRGTLGANLAYRGKYRLVSNNHVLSKNGRIGRDIFQPTPPKAGNDLVTVTGFVPIQYYSNSSEPNPVFNVEDVAWGDATRQRCAPSIEHLGIPQGRGAPTVDARIRKVGAKTGRVLAARIRSTDYRYRSRSRSTNLYSWWKQGILLDQYISAPGDSGALYLDDDNRVVAIHRAGSRKKNRSIGARL